MAGLRDIVVELADQIRAVVTPDEFDVQVEPQWVLTPSPLTIDIYPGDTARDDETAGFDDIGGGYILTVRARINTPDFDEAYDVLLSLMDDDDELCLAQAILDDQTLNGYAADVDVRDQTGLRVYESLDGSSFLGFQVTALVLPAHS